MLNDIKNIINWDRTQYTLNKTWYYKTLSTKIDDITWVSGMFTMIMSIYLDVSHPVTISPMYQPNYSLTNDILKCSISSGLGSCWSCSHDNDQAKFLINLWWDVLRWWKPNFCWGYYSLYNSFSKNLQFICICIWNVNLSPCSL